MHKGTRWYCLRIQQLIFKTRITLCWWRGREIGIWLGRVLSRTKLTEENLAMVIKVTESTYSLTQKICFWAKTLGYIYLHANNKYTRIPLTKLQSGIFHHPLFLSPLLVTITPIPSLGSAYLFWPSPPQGCTRVCEERARSRPSLGADPGLPSHSATSCVNVDTTSWLSVLLTGRAANWPSSLGPVTGII